MDEIVLDLALLLLNRLDLLAVLVDVELRDAADLELEEALDVVVGYDLAANSMRL